MSLSTRFSQTWQGGRGGSLLGVGAFCVLSISTRTFSFFERGWPFSCLAKAPSARRWRAENSDLTFSGCAAS